MPRSQLAFFRVLELVRLLGRGQINPVPVRFLCLATTDPWKGTVSLPFKRLLFEYLDLPLVHKPLSFFFWQFTPTFNFSLQSFIFVLLGSLLLISLPAHTSSSSIPLLQFPIGVVCNPIAEKKKTTPGPVEGLLHSDQKSLSKVARVDHSCFQSLGGQKRESGGRDDQLFITCQPSN